MKKNIIKYEYEITTDPDFQYKKYGISDELQEQLESLYFEARDKNNKKTLDKLTNLVIKYPTIPTLKNYLSLAYHYRGMSAKAIEINNWIITEHPDYLFALLNKANECIDNEDFDKIPLILGENFEIKSLYPDRKIFHLMEVTGYLKVVIRYFSAIGDIEMAENRFDLLKDIAPEHPDTDQAKDFILNLKKKIVTIANEIERQYTITPTSLVKTPVSKTTKAPIFNHKEIQYLYSYGFDIPNKLIKNILDLPHSTLITDLEKVLQDAVNRYKHFESKDYEDKTHTFALHALLLLKEIKAEQSLPNVLSFFLNNEEVLKFWIGDHLTENIWSCFYELGINKTHLLKEFMLTPGVYTYSKSEVSVALCQMALKNPARKQEILNIYSEVLSRFIIAKPEENLLDTDFINLMIGDIIDCRFSELLPLIKVLDDKNYILPSFIGDYNKIKQEITNSNSKAQNLNKRQLLNIFEIYDDVLKNWCNDEYDDNIIGSSNFPPLSIVSNKVGRNDPCPCGSGKKFKNCCIN